MTLTSLSERAYWYARSYGRAVRVRRSVIAAALSALAIIIPVVFPVVAVPALMRYVFRGDLVYRYE